MQLQDCRLKPVGEKQTEKTNEKEKGKSIDVSDQLECMELCLGMDEELTKSLWVRIKGRVGTGDIIVGVCYRPPDQED